MYRIGELVKMAEATPDTIRYYEKQWMVEHEVCIEGGFCLYTESDLQQLKFIRHTRQLGFSLKSIHELLSICVDSKYHICQESRGVTQERLQEVEAWIAELQSMQHSLQRLDDACYETAHSSVYCSILEALEQEASGVKNGCRLFTLAGLHSYCKMTNWNLYELIPAY